MRHAQTVVLQRADGPRRHKIATNQERRRQVLPFLLVKPLAHQLLRLSGAEAGHHQQVAPVAEPEVMTVPRVADPGQAQLHGVATQAQHVHHLPVPHLEQVLCRPLANRAMIRRDGGQAHVAVPAVNQHTGFAHVYRQIVDMRIVDTKEDRRLSVRFVHAGQKQLGIAVVLLQRTATQTHLVRGQPFAHALDDAVVKDVGPLVKRPLRGKHHQAVKQQTPRRHAVHYPQLPRARQHL